MQTNAKQTKKNPCSLSDICLDQLPFRSFHSCLNNIHSSLDTIPGNDVPMAKFI